MEGEFLVSLLAEEIPLILVKAALASKTGAVVMVDVSWFNMVATGMYVELIKDVFGAPQ